MLSAERLITCLCILQLCRSGQGWALQSRALKGSVKFRATTRDSSMDRGQLKVAQPVHDLWVVGAGHLGGLVAQEWRRRHPLGSVVAETATASRHDCLQRSGVSPRLRKDRSPSDIRSASNVLVCFPPSVAGTAWLDEVAAAADLWAGETSPDGGRGLLLFTSSTAVYGVDSDVEIDEDSGLDLSTPRAMRWAALATT